MQRSETDEDATGEVIELSEPVVDDAAATQPAGAELLELMLASQPASVGAGGGVTLGRLVAVSPPTVVFAERPDGVRARTVVPLRRAEVGREVMLQFVRGNLDKPIVAGVLQDSEPVDVEVDGKPVVVEGNKQIVLKCGKASITLTRAGKVIIKGAYVSTHSSGVNRIKGGSVQIN